MTATARILGMIPARLGSTRLPRKVLLDLAGKVIVLTGALQPGRFSDSDAPFNLGMALAAVQLLPPGAYIVANGRVFDARRVRKNLAANRFEDAAE